jgi:hypothetical protein
LSITSPETRGNVMPPTLPNAPTIADLVAAARAVRDRELAGRELPLLKLSWVKRRQRRASPLALSVLAAWVASIFAVIVLVRPLMVARSDWYGLLIILYLIPSIAVMGYGMARVQKRAGLRCPYCGATFIHSDWRNPKRDAATAAEHDRRCGRCQAVIIDLEA